MKAFPNVIPKENFQAVEEGMSLRDYFAAKAMQGELSASMQSQPKPKELAEFSYKVADAMMERRLK